MRFLVFAQTNYKICRTPCLEPSLCCACPACSCLQCTDDSNYCGDYVHGKRHGYGVYSFPNGDQYEGEYEEDIPQV